MGSVPVAVEESSRRDDMKVLAWTAALGAACLAWASPARADDALESRVARVEQQLAAQSDRSAREIQSAVDAYLGSARADASLVGGPGAAGYDGGFWIRGGTFLVKINLTIQTRYEAFRWDEEEDEPSPGGDLSGFSLPRVTLKFSGDATCDIHYYAELEFGHPIPVGSSSLLPLPEGIVGGGSTVDFEGTREAWIEYEAAPAFAVRMGLVKLAATRQLMTPPEMQQFVDISLASAVIGQLVNVGYTDRNRDYGVMVHGVLGCDGEWSYLATVTNGDGPRTRNVLDVTSNDNLAYSARVNWDVKGHIGYEEGALRQHSCEWLLSIGAWGFYYTDVLQDKTHVTTGDRTAYGVDLAAGYGGWSLTSAISWCNNTNSDFGNEFDAWTWLVQLGFLIPDTAWEVAARYSAYTLDPDNSATTFGAQEFGFAVNYYVDGHSDKLTLDVAFLDGGTEDGSIFNDVYAGYHATADDTGLLLRFQWQLAL
jgi:hypothetical protein